MSKNAHSVWISGQESCPDSSLVSFKYGGSPSPHDRFLVRVSLPAVPTASERIAAKLLDSFAIQNLGRNTPATNWDWMCQPR